MSDNVEIIEQAQTTQVPFMPQINLPTEGVNRGTIVGEMTKAAADAQNKLMIAKCYPRDENKALSKMLDVCSRRNFAEKAFYNFSRGGGSVSGLSIRAAEEMARLWGNLEYGIRELSESDGKSEMQAFCWDLETNTMSTQNFTNKHARDVKGSVQQLTSLRDIYEINANMGARRLRARILAILPDYVVEEVISACKDTLRGKSTKPLIDRVNDMVAQFKKLGVSIEMIENRLKKPVAQMTPDDFDEYIGIYNSIKDKMQSVNDWFGSSSVEAKSDLGSTLEALDKDDKKSSK